MDPILMEISARSRLEPPGRRKPRTRPGAAGDRGSLSGTRVRTGRSRGTARVRHLHLYATMKAKLLDDSGERTIALVFDAGDEVIDGLRQFAADQNIQAARFSAIGAFSTAQLGFFDVQRGDYDVVRIDEQVEVLSLAGGIALEGGRPKVHAHVVVGKRDCTAHGGHLLSARVRPTLEVILEQSPARLTRRYDPRYGLALIDIGA
ncbi:MAG TPA: PPC domain-containing DNA-binding protein [Burkholderiales bacterium]|nr:PPC domain-containing DNA-binding protein [Burkholderiales bacterium]